MSHIPRSGSYPLVSTMLYDKKQQSKKPKKKEKLGPTRKEERKQERSDQWEDHDKEIYEQIAERSFDWNQGCSICEWCHQRRAEQMHHSKTHEHVRITSLETVFYLCKLCHDNGGHKLQTKES